MQLQDKGHNSEIYSFGVYKFLSRVMAPDRRALEQHAMLLLSCDFSKNKTQIVASKFLPTNI